jgi:hypothetical protein
MGAPTIIALGSKSLNRLIEMKRVYMLSLHPHPKGGAFSCKTLNENMKVK